MNLTKLAVITTAFLLVTTPATADPFAELDGAVKELNIPAKTQQKEFHQWLTRHMSEYQAWRTEYLKRWDEEREKRIRQWGDGDVDTAHQIVEYSAKNDVRTVVDLDKEEIRIAVVVDSDVPEEEAKRRLKTQVDTQLTRDNLLLNDAGIHADLVELNKRQVTITDIGFTKAQEKAAQTLIIEQTQAQLQEIDKEVERIAGDQSTPKTDDIARQQKQALLNNARQRMQNLHGVYNDERSQNTHRPKPKKKVEYRIALPPSSLSTRAEKFVPLVQKESVRWSISPALILAVIHTESSFNPGATSPIPAYGLMQIVPTSAGHDVNKLMRNIDAPMQVDDLYQADVNVETGAAYLHILDSRYLRQIKHPRSRLYCVIAAYNTGAGNVAKAFNERRIRKAAKKINSMSPEQVYERLIENLPYDETKHYLQKVSQRMRDYSDLEQKS